VVQNTIYVILVRYTRTRPGTMYLSSSAVCCDEGLKLITCLLILTFQFLCNKRRSRVRDGDGGYSQLRTSERNATSLDMDGADVDEEDNPIDKVDTNNNQRSNDYENYCSFMAKQLQFDYRVAVLAALYIVQKNLLYLAMSNLDAAVFQVTYQLKVLTTALFSVLLLKKKLSTQQVIAMIFLTLGVALVQLDKVDENASKSYQEQNRLMGVLAVLGASCTSGFGGVYFELVVKPQTNLGKSETTTPPRPAPSVWAKNVQLSTFGLLIGLVTAFIKDRQKISSQGFFQGYTPWVLAVIVTQAIGGLVVAAIIKYADNILKSFAAGMSIIGSTLCSAWIFGFKISMLFAGGCVMQFISIWLYSMKHEMPPAHQTSELALMRMDSRTDHLSTDIENDVEMPKQRTLSRLCCRIRRLFCCRR